MDFYLESLYWLCMLLAAYPFIVYPMIVASIARLRRAPHDVADPMNEPISIVVAAHNEAGRIGDRVAQLSRIATSQHPQSEVIIVSDGSTDETARIVTTLALPNARLIELENNYGKANALNVGVATARQEWIVFADVRQEWNQNTLTYLLGRFRDPTVGAVSGDLQLREANGALESVDFYWRLEKMLRVNESRWHSCIGVTGAVCAVRKSLFTTLPVGTVLDDVYWPMAVIFQGHRVVHEARAAAYDKLPEQLGGEYQRKLRTLAGNFQLLSLMPSLLLPWKNPVWFQFMSHKVLRLATPWLLLMGWGLSFALMSHWLYFLLWIVQSLAMVAGWLAWCSTSLGRIRPLGIAAAVFALNYAAWLAFWVWLCGGASLAWKKVAYKETGAVGRR